MNETYDCLEGNLRANQIQGHNVIENQLKSCLHLIFP